MDHDTSDGTSSASESSVETPVPRLAKRKQQTALKKRKTTYYARKDEIQLLQDQVQRLEAKLATLERETPRPQSVLADALLTNAALSGAIDQSKFAVAGTQSMLSAHTLATIVSNGRAPLQDYIHLPVDATQRNAIMSSIYESKVHAAMQFMNERTRFLDLRVAHKQIEQFSLPGGLAGIVSMDITPFTAGHSLRQVYDAFMYFVINQEMSISEKLGILTIRESEELEEFTFSQTRFLSSVPGCGEVESNIAMFASYVDATDTKPAFAVGTMDFVDQDDLYPYRPELCLRKDITGAIMLHEIPSSTGGAPSVSLVRWAFTRIHPPQFSLTDEALATAHSTMLHWCDIIPKIMKERLTTIVPA